MFILYTAFSIIAIILIAALFINKNYEVKREIEINQPPVVVYDYLRMIKNHLAFNAWLLKDPNIQVTSKNTDGQVGFVLNYAGNKDVGSGEEELNGLVPNKKIDITLRFLKPLKSTARTPYDLLALPNNHTKVTWTMYGEMKYPMNFALLFINMDNFLGKDIRKSLENLKTNLEK